MHLLMEMFDHVVAPSTIPAHRADPVVLKPVQIADPHPMCFVFEWPDEIHRLLTDELPNVVSGRYECARDGVENERPVRRSTNRVVQLSE